MSGGMDRDPMDRPIKPKNRQIPEWLQIILAQERDEDWEHDMASLKGLAEDLGMISS